MHASSYNVQKVKYLQPIARGAFFAMFTVCGRLPTCTMKIQKPMTFANKCKYNLLQKATTKQHLAIYRVNTIITTRPRIMNTNDMI